MRKRDRATARRIEYWDTPQKGSCALAHSRDGQNELIVSPPSGRCLAAKTCESKSAIQIQGLGLSVIVIRGLDFPHPIHGSHVK